jgi:hypothetical protein
MSKKLFLCNIALLCAAAAFSQDYGLTLRSLPVLTSGEPNVNVEFTGAAVPWFTAPLGERGGLYLSGGISAVYDDKKWQAVPEVYRFEIGWRFASGLRINAGRLHYRDPLGLLMNGLFDGLALNADLGKTRLSAGAFYTGLLYKKTAYIVISPGDIAAYDDGDVYFAPRRLVFSVDWEVPALLGTEGKLDLGLSGQFDLNDAAAQTGGEMKIHSQYALAKFALPFLDQYYAEFGGLLGTIEESDRELGFCFAVSGGLAWLPPGALNDRLSLNGALSSGSWNEAARAFLPVNTIARGRVLRPGISGLALVEGAYTARLLPSLSAEISAAYFFRTDIYTWSDNEIDRDSRSPLLGGEISGSLVWAPLSDISASLGGGIFLPGLGKSLAADAAPRWRISLETIFSF